MKARLTKKKALEICRELWTRIRDRKCKTDADKHAILSEMGYPNMSADCPCCEYDAQNNLNFCNEKCLLSNIWEEGCLSEGSPFLPFSEDEEGTPADAQRIIDGCNAALKALQKEEVQK